MTVLIQFFQVTIDPWSDLDQCVTAWQLSDHGKWVADHATDIKIVTHENPDWWPGHQLIVTGRIEDHALLVEYHLRWS